MHDRNCEKGTLYNADLCHCAEREEDRKKIPEELIPIYPFAPDESSDQIGPGYTQDWEYL